MKESHNQPPDNAFLNLFFNIIVPVVVLNRLSKPLGALEALILALSSPLIYGAWDLYRKKRVNYLSILGLINVSVTGSLAVMKLEGPWFWVKEAAFPLLVGVFVFASRWSERPFIQTLILNPQVINFDLVEDRIRQNNHQEQMRQLIRSSTMYLSFSFLLSALLNFILAQKIFVPIDPALVGEARSLALNDQIAEMTKLSFMVIFAPSLLILAGIMYFLLKQLKQLTGLTMEEILPSK